MPLYDLTCPECKIAYEELLKYDIWKEGLTVCPKCRKEFKCFENSEMPLPSPPVFSGIFTDLTKVQKNNERLKRKTSKG